MNETKSNEQITCTEDFNYTDVEFIDIQHTSWNGVIRSPSGEKAVTVNSISELFTRSGSVLVDEKD